MLLLAGAIQGDIGAHGERQRCAALDRVEDAETPMLERPFRQRMSEPQLRAVQPAHGNDVAPVEAAAAFIELEVKRVRHAGCQSGLRSDHIVISLGERIRAEKRQAAVEPPVHAELRRVIAGPVIVSQIPALGIEQAPRLGEEHAIVHILR